MRNSRIMSFRSKHYPRNASAFRIRQEYAFRYYALLLFIVMIGVVLRINYGKEGLIFGIVGILLAIGLGSIMAQVQLRRSVAEVFFINDGISVISIDDILRQSPKRSFPLRFADPTRSEDQIHFNFEDQIITLKREDWGLDFDLIWNYLTQDLREHQAASPGPNPLYRDDPENDPQLGSDTPPSPTDTPTPDDVPPSA